ncbi:MAG: Holliday junction branch migration protein RuvA [Elusimicrobia bacterium]|nr:Holliday junction branch migration protein RuvA [Elusimicrobiota bacterium]
MIAYLKGTVFSKTENSVVVEVNGVGYDVFISRSSFYAFPETGENVKLFVSESSGIYTPSVLYGFLIKEEKELFDFFRDAVPNTGAKKALDYMEKAVKSLPDFQKAIIHNNVKILTGLFGFTSKTAEKLILALKYKMPDFKISGFPRIKEQGEFTDKYLKVSNALATLGYKNSEIRNALENLRAEETSKDEETEDMLKKALKILSS